MNLAPRSDGGLALTLPAQLTLAAATSLLGALREARGGALTLDASGVERLGASCAQILRAGALAWRKDAAPLCIERPSQAFLDDLAQLGLPADALASETHT